VCKDSAMKEQQHGACGLYCGACGAPDCGGCRSERIDEYVEGCRFRICAGGKGIDFCCFCEEYPCEELEKFMNDEWPHHWTIRANLEYIKENGVEKWLEAQNKEWSCEVCGARINWYQKVCSCGRELEAWDLPE